MRLIPFFLLLFMSLPGLANDSLTIPVKVISYNIRLDFVGDHLDNWHNRKQEVANFIKVNQPDFIGIQEALYHQVEFLDGALEEYEYLGVGRDDGKIAGEFMAIFYKADTWKVGEENTFWLSATPSIPTKGWDAACFRVCTFAEFKNKTGESIALYNTHFDHLGKTAKTKSVEVIKSFLSDTEHNYPSILLGDFNVKPEDSVFLALNTFLTDSRSLARQIQEESIGTFNAFKTTGPFTRRIDYIFVDQEYIQVKKYKVPIIYTETGRQLSDHFPVIAELEIKFYD